MGLASNMEQFKKVRQEAVENYWKAFDQVADTTDKMTDTVLAAFSGFPGVNTDWLTRLREQREQGVTNMKQMVNKFAEFSPGFGSTPDFSKGALKYYQEGVNRVVEQVTAFRKQGREAVDKFAGQVPEPGRQWLKTFNEMADGNMERFKSFMEGDLGSFFQSAGVETGAAPDTKKSAKKPDTK